jgi:hypothetical protein
MTQRRLSLTSRFRGWALRASVLFLGVYVLGAMGTATLVPYVTVLVIIGADGVRLLRR